jgi:hypothetical protein
VIPRRCPKNVHRDPKQSERELAVFACFLEARPTFAAEVESYGPAAEEPTDVDVTLKRGGHIIGFQLGEWLHARQMAEAKRKEGLRRSLGNVLGPSPESRPRNFERVGIFARDSNFTQRDAKSFRDEFLRIVSEADRGWEKDPNP